jgi:hypothetical protein
MFNLLHDKVIELTDKNGVHLDLITSGPEVAGNEATIILNEEIQKELKKGNNRNANRKVKKVKWWNRIFGKGHYKNLINDYSGRENVDVWTHISYLHSKVFYFDRLVSSIGSYNFHHNATDHTYENTILCQDDKLNKEMDEIFVRDMANSMAFKYKKVTEPQN